MRLVDNEWGKTMTQSKKTIYKKVWIWIVAVIVVLGIAGGMYGTYKESVSPNTDAIDSTAVVKEIEKGAITVTDIAKTQK